MDPIRFEEFVADIWSSQGWDTKLTSTSHDRGIDVIASRDGVISRKEAIQVKRYQSDKISSREVQRYASIPDQEDDVETVRIVPSSSFSQPAEELADDLNVKTVDGDGLYQIVSDNSLSSVVAPYLAPEADTKPDTNAGSPTEIEHNNTTQSAQDDLRTQHTASARTEVTEQSDDDSLEQQIPDVGYLLKLAATFGVLSIVFSGLILALGGGFVLIDDIGESDSGSNPTVVPSAETFTETNNQPSSKVVSPMKSSTEADTEPSYTAVNSTATYGDHKITLVGYEVREEALEDAVAIPEGAVRLYLKIRYENIGGEKQRVPRVDAEYSGDDVEVSKPRSETYSERYPSGSEIYPEVTKSGWIYYELPMEINYQRFSLFVSLGDGSCGVESTVEYNVKTGNKKLVEAPVCQF
jgi:Predicted endonuclease distantly related to archaeal Holliday junction resolvase and Mrr-like restriction enzymes